MLGAFENYSIYKPDIAVMEPTGTNYSRLWGTHLARNGVEVRLVGHNQLSVHRSVIGYSDKDDEPIEILKLGRKSKKPTKRYLSQRRFEKADGSAYQTSENEDGFLHR